jgi:hypothetical protein
MGFKEKGISTIHIDSLGINKYDKFCFFTQYSNIPWRFRHGLNFKIQLISRIYRDSKT